MAYTRTETRFGAAKAVGTSATEVCQIPSGTTANVLIHLANIHTAAIQVTVFIADNSWDESGDPAAGELVAIYQKDTSIDAGGSIDLAGIVLDPEDYVVVKSSAASSLDVVVSGTARTGTP